jgi:hypothetical protein
VLFLEGKEQHLLLKLLKEWEKRRAKCKNDKRTSNDNIYDVTVEDFSLHNFQQSFMSVNFHLLNAASLIAHAAFFTHMAAVFTQTITYASHWTKKKKWAPAWVMLNIIIHQKDFAQKKNFFFIIILFALHREMGIKKIKKKTLSVK